MLGNKNLIFIIGGGGAVPPLDDLDQLVADIIGMDASNVSGIKGVTGDTSDHELEQLNGYVQLVNHCYDLFL